MNLLRDSIVWENPDALVLNKPAGLLSQKDKSGVPDAADLLKKELGLSFLAPVHRLDRNSSGLLLLAKNSSAAAKLTENLKEREIQRSYLAIVKGDPGEKGTIDAPLSKDEDRNETSVETTGKEAITHFVRRERMNAASLVEVTLETGRSHQIRAHMAHIKCCLIGDRKYGKKPWSEIFSRPALHAFRLIFPNPASGSLERVEVPLPGDMQELLKKLGAKNV